MSATFPEIRKLPSKQLTHPFPPPHLHILPTFLKHSERHSRRHGRAVAMTQRYSIMKPWRPSLPPAHTHASLMPRLLPAHIMNTHLYLQEPWQSLHNDSALQHHEAGHRAGCQGSRADLVRHVSSHCTTRGVHVEREACCARVCSLLSAAVAP